MFCWLSNPQPINHIFKQVGYRFSSCLTFVNNNIAKYFNHF